MISGHFTKFFAPFNPHPTTETIAVGGVMNAKNEPALRIDTTQHQMHAVVMAMSSVYTSISSVA